MASRSTVGVDLIPARPARRMLAGALDFVPVAGYILLLLCAGLALNRRSGFASRLASPIAMDALAFLTLVLPVILYFAVQEGSARQATWGKRRAGLRVVARSGRRLTPGRALLRAVVKFLPWQFAHSAALQLRFGSESALAYVAAVGAQGLAVAYLLCLWLTRSHRTPYDWAAGSEVVGGPEVMCRPRSR